MLLLAQVPSKTISIEFEGFFEITAAIQLNLFQKSEKISFC